MKKTIFSTISCIVLTTSAFAHLQMLYTPSLALTESQTIELRYVFSHPFTNDSNMDMGKQHDSKKLAAVEEFYVVNRGKKKDLKNTLEEINFKSKNNSAKAFASKYKARRVGDHVLVLKPAPYYLENEDYYIQQITKTIVNVLGFPSDWEKELGLETEIIPLTKPYAIWETGSFTGIVKSNGKPIPYASIDVEYLNSNVDLNNNSMGEKPKYKAPQGSFITMRIRANKDGEFTFAIPKEGFWSFCALGTGTKKEYKGKKLRQDAVIWIQAQRMQE